AIRSTAARAWVPAATGRHPSRASSAAACPPPAPTATARGPTASSATPGPSVPRAVGPARSPRPARQPAPSATGRATLSTLVSIFCIQPTFNATVDAAGDLPGPGAVSLPGTAQLLP